MSKNQLTIKAKKPKPIISRPLSFDARSFALALAKGAGHALLGKFDDLADDGIDALSAIGLADKGPETLAYTLIQNAISSAITSLLSDTK